MPKEKRSIVSRKLVSVKKKKRVRKVAQPKKAAEETCYPPGIVERALMMLSKILRSLLKLVEKKIKDLKVARLSKRMDEKD